MGWPQYVYLALTAIGAGVALAKHGEAQTGNHNFWVDLIVSAVLIWILYMGGFFTGAAS